MDTKTLLEGINCTGCLACLDKCPKKCIQSGKDENGFYVPLIDESKCINCHQCINKCPARIEVPKNKPIKSFVGYIKSEDEYCFSSSGGAFYAFAKYIIKSNGKVCGVTYDAKENVAKHIIINSQEEIIKLQGSKYVQSDTAGIYEKIQQELLNGNVVLFSGTPCQIAGLYSVIDSPLREKLFTVEVICHGVSNAEFLKKSLLQYKRTSGEIQSLRFKNKSKYEKTAFSLRIEYKNGKTIIVPAFRDLYYRMYVDGLFYRKTCYECRYTTRERMADITLGDCSTYKDYTELNQERAFSTIIINSKKGDELWEKCKCELEYVTQNMEKEFQHNAQLSHPVVKPENLSEIYSDYKSLSIDELKKKYVKFKFKEFLNGKIKGCISLRTRNKLKQILKR